MLVKAKAWVPALLHPPTPTSTDTHFDSHPLPLHIMYLSTSVTLARERGREGQSNGRREGRHAADNLIVRPGGEAERLRDSVRERLRKREM